MFMRDGVDDTDLKDNKVSEKELNEKPLRQLIHGDDNWVIGYRKTPRKYFDDELDPNFVCKLQCLVSRHEDDAKEGKFLRRKVRQTSEGWEYEADDWHARKLLERYGLSTEDAKGAATPGVKQEYDEAVFKDDAERDEYDPPLEGSEIKEHRGGVGTAGFLAGDRTDIKYPVKEVQRDGARPRQSTRAKMKRLARHIKRVPRDTDV